MASLNIAGHGCGIRYKYGFFESAKLISQIQKISFKNTFISKNELLRFIDDYEDF